MSIDFFALGMTKKRPDVIVIEEEGQPCALWDSYGQSLTHFPVEPLVTYVLIYLGYWLTEAAGMRELRESLQPIQLLQRTTQ